jgi:hypothetical protein
MFMSSGPYLTADRNWRESAKRLVDILIAGSRRAG